MRPLCFWILLFSAFGGASVQPVMAQLPLDGGIALGMNVATLRAASADQLGYRTAAVGGLFGQVTVADPFAVRGEVLFSQKGTTVDTQLGELTLKANYLEFPLVVVGQLPFARTYGPHLLAGPALGVKLYERQGAPGFSFRTDETVFKRTDVGVVVGAGASLGGPGALIVEVRYTLGMRDATETVTAEPLSTTLPDDGTNGVFSVLLRFGL